MGKDKETKAQETAKKQERALDLYGETCDVVSACQGAGISRATWYRWAANDEDFQDGIIKARERVADNLEREAVKRALSKSDTLIIFLLKGLKPNTYHERISSEVTHNSRVTDPGRVKLTDAQLDKLINLAQDVRDKRKIDKLTKQNTVTQAIDNPAHDVQ